MSTIIICPIAMLLKRTTGILVIPNASTKCSLSKVTADLGGGQCMTSKFIINNRLYKIRLPSSNCGSIILISVIPS